MVEWRLERAPPQKLVPGATVKNVNFLSLTRQASFFGKVILKGRMNMGHIINGNVDKALESFHTAFTL